MSDKQPNVSIITVNYNGKQYLEAFFTALEQLDYPRKCLKIIFVDNGSTDGSVAYVKKTWPSVVTIKSKRNNYAHANNLGIKKATGEYVAFLNPDTVVDPLWLRVALSALAQQSTVGVVGGKVLLMDGRIHSAGHIEYSGYRWADRGFREKDKGQYDIQTEVSSLCGCAVVYKKECLDAVGSFDEDFNMFLEDVDMAKRCQEKGWTLLYEPRAIVHHHYHGVMTEEVEEFYVQRNRLLIAAKYSPEDVPEVIESLAVYVAKNGIGVEANIWVMIQDMLAKLLASHSLKKSCTYIPPIVAALRKRFSLSNEEMSREIDVLTGDVEEQQALLDKQTADMQGMKEEIQEREELFKTAITDFQKRLDEQNGILCEMRQTLREKEIELSDLNNTLALIYRDKEQQDKASGGVSMVEDERNPYLRAVHEQNALVNEHKKQIVAKDKLIENLTIDLENAIDAHHCEGVGFQQQLVDMQRNVDALNEQLEQKVHAVRVAEDRVQEKEGKINEYVRKLADFQDALYAQKEAFAQEKAQREAEFREQMNEREQCIQEKQQEFNARLRHLEGALSENEQKLQQVTHDMGEEILRRDTHLMNCEKEFTATVARKNTEIEQERSQRNTLEMQLKNERASAEAKRKQWEQELSELDCLISERDNEVQQLKDHIVAFYESGGYRYILRPLLAVIQPIIRPFKRS